MTTEEWRGFYRETKGKLMAWVMARVKERADAEEIVQDSYLSFLDSLPVFDGRSSLWTYLVGIAKHEVMDYWRKKYAKRAIQLAPFMGEIYSEPIKTAAITAGEIERIYTQLTMEQRLILVMKYEENKTLAEIAKKLGVGLKAAESRLFRARRAFKVAYSLATRDSGFATR